MLFKKGIEPKWEDPMNEFGGSLITQIDNVKDKEIDDVWKNLVFGIVGNSIPNAEHINGFRFLDRLKKHNHVKIEIWIDCGLAKHVNN